MECKTNKEFPVTCHSINQFSNRLKKFLYQEHIFNVLPEIGWLDGGCRSLMKVLQLWLGEHVETYQIVKQLDQQHSEHALVRVGEYFIDGDGVSTLEELIRRWYEEEGFSNVIIRPFNPLTEPVHINGEEPFYIEEDVIVYLVSELDKYFSKENVLELMK